MATYTTNLNLKKPDTTDNVSIADINGNMDIIDAQIKANADAVSGKADDSNLLPKVNGTAGQVWTSGGDGTASWANAPSGGSGDGEVWEAVSLTKFPSDWVEGEKVRIVNRLIPYSDVDSWTTAPTSVSTYLGDSTPYDFVLKSTQQNLYLPIYLHDYYNKNCISVVILSGIQTVNVWNGAGNPLLTLELFSFNGGGKCSSSVRIVKGDINSNSNVRIYRLKK